MKKTFATIIAALACCIGAGAQELIVRIDDMGAMHSANKASIDCYANGTATIVEVMPVAGWFPEAVKMLKENPGLDVGVHLAITSEWDNVKWRPLTPCPSLCDEAGYFLPMMNRNKNYPGKSILESAWDLDEIEREFRAQIELCLKEIPWTSHISGHMGALAFSPKVKDLVSALCEEYGLVALDHASSCELLGYESVSYAGPRGTLKERIQSMINMLDKMQPGHRYLFLDHPAYDDSEMETVSHIGYENVAADRQGVRDAICSKQFKKALADRGIKLVSVRDIARNPFLEEIGTRLDKSVDKAELQRQFLANKAEWDAAYKFLQRTDLADLPLGRIDLTGNGTYANVQEYTPDATKQGKYEYHRKYIDIQYIVSGSEIIYVCPLSDCREKVDDFDPAKDCGFYWHSVAAKSVPVSAGHYVILFPNDAHMPCRPADGVNVPVKKVVVKVPAAD